jgi:signal transduction histidine kinase
VIYTFQQILNPKTPGSAAAGLASVDAKGMTKLDAYTARIPCNTPFATLAEALAIPGYSDIIPVGYDLTAPAGTGPFKVKSFSPGTQSTFVRYDGYWQSGLPYLDEVVITDYSDQTSQVNALLAGQVDVVNLLSADVISEVQGEGKNILLSDGGGWNPFTMRVDTGTFSDVRVRQAMRLVVDRQQMLDLVFGGFGTLGNDLFGIWAPEYDHSLPQRHQDIDQAKSLLKAAGAEDLHVTLVTSDIAQGTVLAAQVFAQQASQAGVTVNVSDVTVDEFYGTNYLKWQFARMSGTYGASVGGPISAGFGRSGTVCTVASPIVVEGRLWGAMVVAASEELPPDAEERMEKVGELVATAIANAESKSELAASRRRIVAASDDARRRIERDLHDGTQQRLVSLGLAVRVAQSSLPSDLNDLRSELSRIATGLAEAVEELQELSRGIHPAILAQGGLAPTLRTLARRSAIPVALDIRMDTRLPAAIEVAAYYVMSEALANAAKHAQASRIDISVTARDGRLMLSIRDDGIGGAGRSRGSGLVGLTDRVEALGGSISIESPPGAGTRVTAELPLELEVREER